MMTATGPSSTALATYSYDALSRRTALAYGNGMSTSYSYSDAGDLLTLNHTTNGAPHFTYTYTPAHQLLTETSSNANYAWAPSTAASDSYAAVNALNQYPNVNGGAGSGTDCQGHAQAYSYDCSGNLTGDGIWAYTYDPENHMMSASKTGTSVSYAYDPLGRRETKTVGATVANFLDDGDDEIAEYDGAGVLSRRFVPGSAINDPIAMVTGSGGTLARQYFRANRQGSVIDSENDAGTKVDGPIRYDPFGNCFPTAQCNGTTPYRFTGMRLDTETGLLYDRARMYSSVLGRFPQTDPVGYASDVNLYAYVYNDPTDKTDPSGNGPKSGCIGVVSYRGNTNCALSWGATAASPNGDGSSSAPIYGNPQSATSKPGDPHEFASEVLGTHLAGKNDVEAVYYNRQLNTITNGEIESTRRPDVTVVMKDGRVLVYEILSGRQTPRQMEAKYWGTPEHGSHFRLGPITSLAAKQAWGLPEAAAVAKTEARREMLDRAMNVVEELALYVAEDE